MSAVVSVAAMAPTNADLEPVPERKRPPTAERPRPDPSPVSEQQRRPATAPRAQTSAQKKLIKRPIPGDPDDLIETIDMGGRQGGFSEISITRPDATRKKVMIGLVALAALAVLILIVALAWPSSEPAPPKKQPAVKTTKPPVSPPAKTRVQVRAPKGTVISVDGTSVAPGESLERSPGAMKVVFTCPKKKASAQAKDVDVPQSADVFTVDLSCP